MAIAPTEIRIGTAGWSIPPGIGAHTDRLSSRESILARYARIHDACEVNSSFHRHHMPATYARWAATTPPGFRFSTKVPKTITHGARLDPSASEPILDRFLGEIAHLEDKAGPVLVQLPPSLAFDDRHVERFLSVLRERWSGDVVFEPRHATWFTSDVDELLASHRMARASADPAINKAAAQPGASGRLAYLRLHGSPRTYHSSYEPPYLTALADRLRHHAASEDTESVWCIFDNTASGAAMPNAIDLRRLLGAPRPA